MIFKLKKQIEKKYYRHLVTYISLGTKITADGDCIHEIKDACSLGEKLWQT